MNASNETANRFFAIMSADKSGPAYGVGISEADAREDAVEWGFDGGICVEITESSYRRILAGNPDDVEVV